VTRLTIVLIASVLAYACGSQQPQTPASAPGAAAGNPAVAKQTSFELINNLIFVRAQINQSRPLTFIVDTAASGSVISDRSAKELGLSSEGTTTAVTGGGSIVTSDVKDVDVSLAGVQLSDITMASISLGGLEAGFGMRVDGILGYELFDRYVVEIDFESRLLRVHESAAYQGQPAGHHLLITIEENVPFVRVALTNNEGKAVEGDFEFDTGQTGTLTVSHAFATAHQLFSAGQKSLEMTTGALLPGTVNARVIRVPAVQLGPYRADNVVALVTEQTGIAAHKAGILGNEFLRRFTLTIDYKRQRVTLEPNSQLKSPYEFDMSGMSLMAEGDALRQYAVRTVITGTPAAAAGIRPGDTLVSLDGKPADQLSIAGVREALRRPDVEYTLVLRRGTNEIRTKLRTRRLI
jgi:predicted aspartyl protease